MSVHRVMSVTKTKDGMVRIFTQPVADEWGETKSLTIPDSEAKKLAGLVQNALHPKAKGK